MEWEEETRKSGARGGKGRIRRKQRERKRRKYGNKKRKRKKKEEKGKIWNGVSVEGREEIGR